MQTKLDKKKVFDNKMFQLKILDPVCLEHRFIIKGKPTFKLKPKFEIDVDRYTLVIC